ncbi:Mitochondrial presequence protease [Gossypium arboreum]|uniref:Mitochondrial presequence protease n=1 Tax=Gossypium arboreum TaxID=29729 RepID=A0A0B0ML28_GOSAR|nr:Mitochondrial presequence protease [Gossypium arboreum]
MSQICLTQAYILRSMHVPDMSYTGLHLEVDACPRHVLH